MKRLSAVALLVLPLLAARSFAGEGGAPTSAPAAYEPTWPSLQRHPVPDWYRDAKLGIFVHWGPQTLAPPAGPADGSKSSWKDLAGRFKGEKFDAARCAGLFREAGARYVVQVVEHHDGYALYDSTLTPWSSVKMLPRRDFARELSEAVRKEGLVYGASSHTEENWWFYSDPPKKVPPLPKAGQPAAGEQPPKEWLETWYARLVEIVDKYDPQVFWFDWSIEQPAYEPYLRKFASYYYNRAESKGSKAPGVVINYKYDAFPPGAGVLDVSVGTSRFSWEPEGVRPAPWQFDTWSSRGLWFWRPEMQVRPSAAVIAEMADVVSKNGNYLLNVTPDPDGVVSPAQVEMLAAIGRWLDVNGEAIYGTRPWRTFGEGPTAGLGPSFRPDVPRTPYTAADVRYSARGDALYAIVLAWPHDGRVTLRSLAADAAGGPAGVRRVSLLGSDAPAKWERGPGGLAVDLSGAKPTALPFVLKVEGRL